MQQISRPYQIALVVLVLAAATWFVAFGHHSNSGSGSPSSSSASSSSSQPGESASASSGSSGSSASSPSPIYHGSAPGVEGLTKDIAKAHAAVGTSEAYARHQEEKSAQATATTPSEAAAQSTKPATPTPAPASKHATTTTPSTSASTHVKATHTTTPSGASVTTVKVRAGAPAGQKAVEEAVARGKVALVLFWNPTGTNDHTVRSQVQSVEKNHLPVVVFEAFATEVALYGAITRQVPVYGTPTILLVGAKDATSLTGLQDAFSIEQAIREVHAG